MKVILIKDCKDGKVNQIIDVSNGYATNFLIKQGYALPVNEKTKQVLQTKLVKLDEENAKQRAFLLEVKEKIENIKLSFKLKTHNMVVHGSITKKQILQALIKEGIKIESHMIDHVQIESLGLTNVTVNLAKDIKAKLKVEVESE